MKGIGGFYYVKTSEGIVCCKARGTFRNMKLKPMVGDFVRISEQENGYHAIEAIFERKNELIRPPVANIDTLLIVCAMVSPAPNTFVIDKLCAVCERKGIEPVIVFNKTDLKSGQALCDVYRHAGFQSFCVSAKTGKGIEQIKQIIKGKTTVFTGNSGAGKSSILNAMEPALSLQTGEISKKLGRGRHTTRSCEIFEICGGEVVDTPGFSSLEIEKLETVLKEDLQYCFREFEPFLNGCRFTSCAHVKETGCAVRAAVENGQIESSRYDSYVQMYDEIKHLKHWQIEK